MSHQATILFFAINNGISPRFTGAIIQVLVPLGSFSIKKTWLAGKSSIEMGIYIYVQYDFTIYGNIIVPKWWISQPRLIANIQKQQGHVGWNNDRTLVAETLAGTFPKVQSGRIFGGFGFLWMFVQLPTFSVLGAYRNKIEKMSPVRPSGGRFDSSRILPISVHSCGKPNNSQPPRGLWNIWTLVMHWVDPTLYRCCMLKLLSVKSASPADADHE